MTTQREEILFLVIILTFFAGLMVFLGYCKKEERKTVYEITVVDKYETLGSSYHLVGGRATETEYHLIYESRLVKKNFFSRDVEYHRRGDREVSADVYRRTRVGAKTTHYRPDWN